MIRILVETWWIPLVYVALGLVLVGGPHTARWRRLVEKVDGVRVPPAWRGKLSNMATRAGLAGLGASWFLVVVRNWVGMHPFIFGTFFLQETALGFLAWGAWLRARESGRGATPGVAIGHLLVFLYAGYGVIVVHDILWCARRTAWYTRPAPAGPDLWLFCTLFRAPYDYQVFGEAMVLQLALMVGASLSLFAALRKYQARGAGGPGGTGGGGVLAPLLLAFAALACFALATDLVDDIRFYGATQYALAVHLYLPVTCAVVALAFGEIQDPRPGGGRGVTKGFPRWHRALNTTTLVFLANSTASLVGCAVLVRVLGVPTMGDGNSGLYEGLTSALGLPWEYASISLVFAAETALISVIVLLLARTSRRNLLGRSQPVNLFKHEQERNGDGDHRH
ncbi:MAG: hypothetical protein ACTSU5_08765 [Promethearchaeota archaeon]